jgi:uncharacterized protein (TIGR03546 family)
VITRSIGKVLRGKATPLHLTLACILGSLLGFLPGFADGSVLMQSPGLLALLLVLLAILNANLALAGIVGMLAKLASLALMPLSFEIGRILLDGPGRGIMTKAINAPVLALFGFEYYATTGGIVVGLVFGVLCAVVAVGAVGTFRRRMARLEEGSEAFKKYAGKKWAKILTFVFIGGNKGKRTYAQLLEKKMGNPIRIMGVAAVVLAAGLLFILQAFFKDELTTTFVRRGLENANGATVDLNQATLDLKQGRLLLTNLAVADPQRLETDIFRAQHLEAKISTSDLLRKRIAIDTILSEDATTGEQRARRGFLINPRPAPAPPPKEPEQKTIDDYLKNAQAWKDRLNQAKRWLDDMERRRAEDESAEEGGTAQQESLRDRLRREVREHGWARVAAWHLIEKAPTVLIRSVEIKGLKTQPLPGRTEPDVLDVHARNISTQPWLIADGPQVTITSRSKLFDFDAALAGVAQARSESTLRFAYRGIPADLVGDQIKLDDVRPLQGGTIDVESSGTLLAGLLNLPLNVTLRDTTMSLPKAGSAPIKEMPLSIGVTGPLQDPRILFDQKAFADALTKAGANELAARARGEITKVAEKATEEATRKIEEKVAPKLAEATGSLTEKAGDKLPGDLKDKVPDIGSGLGGLLPGKKKDEKK